MTKLFPQIRCEARGCPLQLSKNLLAGLRPSEVFFHVRHHLSEKPVIQVLLWGSWSMGDAQHPQTSGHSTRWHCRRHWHKQERWFYFCSFNLKETTRTLFSLVSLLLDKWCPKNTDPSSLYFWTKELKTSGYLQPQCWQLHCMTDTCLQMRWHNLKVQCRLTAEDGHFQWRDFTL